MLGSALSCCRVPAVIVFRHGWCKEVVNYAPIRFRVEAQVEKRECRESGKGWLSDERGVGATLTAVNLRVITALYLGPPNHIAS